MTLILGPLPVPIFGTGGSIIDVGRSLHRVPTEIVRKKLREDLEYACDEASGWFAVVPLHDGKTVLMPSDPDLPKPREDVLDTMVRLGTLANAGLHHGGHWVIAWDGNEIHALWRDHGGDLQFEIGFAEPWVRIQARAPHEWADTLEAAWQEMARRHRMVERKPEETYHRALGEMPTSATRH